jgi:hypothetical protein
MLTEEQQKAKAYLLTISPTLQAIAIMAHDCLDDLCDLDNINALLALTSNHLMHAVDNNRIHFKNDEDKAMFFELLVTIIQVHRAFKERDKSNVSQAPIK